MYENKDVYMKSTNRMISAILDIVEMVDKLGESNNYEPIFAELGLGYRALSRILRDGAIGIINLQHKYHSALEDKMHAEIGEKEARDYLEDVFGDRDAPTINDEDKERIKEYVKKIEAGWDKED